MVRRTLVRMSLAVLSFCLVRPALAGQSPSTGTINFTGNVAQDFTGGSVTTIVNDPIPGNPSQSQPGQYHNGQDPRLTSLGLVNGFAIQDLRTSYNASTDTMYVGVHFFSIAGNPYGTTNPAVIGQFSNGVSNPPNLGGSTSITVAFAPTGAGDSTSGPASGPTVVAGVPADKTQAGTGIDGFNVASYKGIPNGIAYNYGQTLTNNMGALAFDPTAAHPDFEFTIKNFSKLPGMNLANGYWLEAYAGSLGAVIAGPDTVAWTHLPSPEAISTPEPATIALWLAGLGGAAWKLRRRARRDDSV